MVGVSTCWHPSQASVYTENSRDPINGAVHWKQHHCVNSLCVLPKSKREGPEAISLIDWNLKKVRTLGLKFLRLDSPYCLPFQYHSKAHVKNKSYKYTRDFKAFSFLPSSKEPTHRCRRRIKDVDLTPGSGRSPEGHGNPLQYSCLENPHGQRSLVCYSPWGHKDSDTAEPLSTYKSDILLGIRDKTYTWFTITIIGMNE